MKKTITEDEIRALVNKDLLEIMGLDKISEEKKVELREKMAATIENRVFRRVTKELTEKGKFDEFEKIAQDDKDPSEFLKKNGINTERIYIEEAILYKSQMKVAANFVDIGLSK